MTNPLLTPPRRRPKMRPGVVELLDLTLLSLEARKVRGAAVDARGGSCLEARDLESGAFELLGQVSRCGFSSPPSGETHLGADVNPTAKAGAGRDYDGAHDDACAKQHGVDRRVNSCVTSTDHHDMAVCFVGDRYRRGHMSKVP